MVALVVRHGWKRTVLWTLLDPSTGHDIIIFSGPSERLELEVLFHSRGGGDSRGYLHSLYSSGPSYVEIFS